MTAGRYDFVIEQGATFSRVITWRDAADALVNLSGYTGRMQIRDKRAGTTLVDFSTGSRMTLGGAAGTITLALTAVETAALDWSGLASYTLELQSSGGVVTRLLEGTVRLSLEVTT